MRYRTVNLLAPTYELLVQYKVAGRSFDDVVLDLMRRVSPADYRREVLLALAERSDSRGGRPRLEREMTRAWQRLLAARRKAGHRGR